jgi:hypothetical protein
MIDCSAPSEDFQLDCLLLLQRFIERVGSDPTGAGLMAREALGLPDTMTGMSVYKAFLLIVQSRLDEARPLLEQAGVQDPSMIWPAYRLLALVFKYFNTGLPFHELPQYGMGPVVAFYRAHPNHPDAHRALIDLLLYFGSVESLTNILPTVDPACFAADIDEYHAYLHRLDAYHDSCTLSIVLVTGQQPSALRHTLAGLREALWCDDVEIVAGVNDDWPQTRAVLAEAGVDRVVVNPAGNTGIDFYQALFPLAGGRYLLQIGDSIQAFPLHFDRDLIDALESDPALGAVGHWPARYHLSGGGHQPALPPMHQMQSLLDRPFGVGPVSGTCTGMRRHDFLTINGFGRATLSRQTGTEMQLARKLALRGQHTGVFFDRGLEVNIVNG